MLTRYVPVKTSNNTSEVAESGRTVQRECAMELEDRNSVSVLYFDGMMNKETNVQKQEDLSQYQQRRLNQ